MTTIDYGTVTHNGKTYRLTSQAEPTSRCLPGGYVNYCNAKDGEAYDFEMAAFGIGPAGEDVRVFWLFSGLKGDDDYELDSYDYDQVDRVEEI